MPVSATSEQVVHAMRNVQLRLDEIESLIMGWVIGPKLTDAQQNAIVDHLGSIADVLQDIDP